MSVDGSAGGSAGSNGNGSHVDIVLASGKPASSAKSGSSVHVVMGSKVADIAPSDIAPTVSQCFFECGATSDQTKFVNMGNARSTKLACPACFSAKKAIDAQGRSTPENKEALQTMKALRQGEYKQLVRASRITSVSGGNSAAHMQRRGQLSQALASWTTSAAGFREHYIYTYIYIHHPFIIHSSYVQHTTII